MKFLDEMLYSIPSDTPEWARIAKKLFYQGSGSKHAVLVKSLRENVFRASDDDLKRGLEFLTSDEMEKTAKFLGGLTTYYDENLKWIELWKRFNALGYGSIHWSVIKDGIWINFTIAIMESGQ